MPSTQIVLSKEDAAFAYCITNSIKRGKQNESCSTFYAADTFKHYSRYHCLTESHLICRSVVPSSGLIGKSQPHQTYSQLKDSLLYHLVGINSSSSNFFIATMKAFFAVQLTNCSSVLLWNTLIIDLKMRSCLTADGLIHEYRVSRGEKGPLGIPMGIFLCHCHATYQTPDVSITSQCAARSATVMPLPGSNPHK